MYHAPLSVLAHFTAAVHQTVIERRKRNSRPVAQKKKKKKKIRRSSRRQVDGNTMWGSRIRPQICFYMNRIKSYDRECTKKKKKKKKRPDKGVRAVWSGF